MGAISAAIGWYLDANREFVQVEAGHAAEPADPRSGQGLPAPARARVRRPSRCLAIVLTLGPWLLTLPAPAGSPRATTARRRPPRPTCRRRPPPISTRAGSSSRRIHRSCSPSTTSRTACPTTSPSQDPRNDATYLFDGEVDQGRGHHHYELPPLPAGTYHLQVHRPPAHDRHGPGQGGTRRSAAVGSSAASAPPDPPGGRGARTGDRRPSCS